MKIDLLIHSANQLLTITGQPQRGRELGQLGLINNGAVAVDNGRILASGPSEELITGFEAHETIDATGKVVLPGFVDPHTHLIWMGDRSAEFEMRIAGASYLEIMAAGGGIAATVTQTRAASVEDMIKAATPRLDSLLLHGTTCIEAKTGYGLDSATEIRMLEAILTLDRQHPIDIVPTFLGAHAIPPEFNGRTDAYTDLVCNEMLPSVKEWWQQNAPARDLPFVDVFCEEGAFDLDQSRSILEKAHTLQFPLKIHADEFNGLGGTALAVELGAASADHLVKTPAADIQKLGKSNTVAVGLPCTPFGLAETDYTPAQKILAAGGILALASDMNPGTAWCESMQFVIALACRYMGITPRQAIPAATINAAAAINKAHELGSLTTGKQADILILDIPDYRHLGYRFGGNLGAKVIKKGIVYPQ